MFASCLCQWVRAPGCAPFLTEAGTLSCIFLLIALSTDVNSWWEIQSLGQSLFMQKPNWSTITFGTVSLYHKRSTLGSWTRLDTQTLQIPQTSPVYYTGRWNTVPHGGRKCQGPPSLDVGVKDEIFWLWTTELVFKAAIYCLGEVNWNLRVQVSKLIADLKDRVDLRKEHVPGVNAGVRRDI